MTVKTDGVDVATGVWGMYQIEGIVVDLCVWIGFNVYLYCVTSACGGGLLGRSKQPSTVAGRNLRSAYMMLVFLLLMLF